MGIRLHAGQDLNQGEESSEWAVEGITSPVLGHTGQTALPGSAVLAEP